MTAHWVPSVLGTRRLSRLCLQLLDPMVLTTKAASLPAGQQQQLWNPDSRGLRRRAQASVGSVKSAGPIAWDGKSLVPLTLPHLRASTILMLFLRKSQNSHLMLFDTEKIYGWGISCELP